MENTARTLYL